MTHHTRGWVRTAGWIAAAVSLSVPLSGLIASVNPHAAGAAISTYSAPGIDPSEITSGPDGALWFTNGGLNSIGRITTSGTITKFTDASISDPEGIVAGPDGALWFANQGNDSIGRITTSGTVTNFTDASISTPWYITSGPDGALWFTNFGNDSIGRITTSGVVTNFTDAAISGPEGIASGPDGALWFTNVGNDSIGRITTSGSVTSFPDAGISFPKDIASGPDGALWFTNYSNGSVGRITTSGTLTSFSDPTITRSQGITAGPDGALWFTHSDGSVARITTSGTITKFTDPYLSGTTYGITSGPDGALWFTSLFGEIWRLGPPKANDTCTRSQSCLASVEVVASASSPSVSVAVTGKPTSARGTVKVKLAVGTLTCPTVPAGKRAVGTLTNTGFAKKVRLRLTVTLRHATGTNAARLCLRKKQPFKSQSPSTSKPGGGAGLLLTCKQTKSVAPCVVSSKAVGTSTVVTFDVPGGDPQFSVQWPKGGLQSWLSKFGQGTVGTGFKAQLQARGGLAPYKWKVMSGKLPEGLTINASTGAISGTPTAAGKFPIKVQATDGERPAKKTKAETVPIVINAPR